MTEETALPADIGARVLADRTARKMSRRAYAELTGLTMAKISNLEKGRPPREDEIDKLRHLAFVEPIASTFGVPHPPAAPAAAAPAAPAAAEQTDAEIDYHARQGELVAAYNATCTRLDGKPCPPSLPYHTSWGTPDVATPAMWPRILTWCVDVNAWLDTFITNPAGETGEIGETVLDVTAQTTEPAVLELTVVGGAGISNRGLTLDVPPDEEDDEEPEPAEITDAENPEGFANGVAAGITDGVPAVAAAAQEIVDAASVPKPAFPDDGARRFSNGQLRTIKRCKREYWLTYYRRLGLATEAMTGAAPLGTRVHRCLAVLYVPADQEFGDPLAELQRTYEEDLEKVAGDEVAIEELCKDVDLAQAMLEGYMQWLEETGADEGLTIVAPETTLDVPVEMPVDVPVRLIAKIDVRAIREFAGIETRVFLDHKTVQSFADVTKMVQFDEQMLHYDLCEFLDYLAKGATPGDADQIRTDGAIYNMLRKVKRTAQAKPPFYERVEIRHNLDTLRSYWLRVQGTIEEILELERKLDAGEDHRKVAPPNPTRDCSWRCDFYHVCTMLDDGSRAEDMLTEHFVQIDPLRRYARDVEGVTL